MLKRTEWCHPSQDPMKFSLRNSLLRVADERTTRTTLNRRLKFLQPIKMIGDKMPLAMQRAIIRVLQKPHFEQAHLRIEIRCRTEDA